MVVSSKRDDVIYRWLSKVDSRNVSFPSKSTFTQRENSTNTTHFDDPCGTHSKGNKCGKGTELVTKIQQAPHIAHYRSLPLSGHRHSIAMKSDREAQDADSGIMQNFTFTSGHQDISDARARVPDNRETGVGLCVSRNQVFDVGPAAGSHLQFTTPNDILGPHGGTIEMPGSRSYTAQCPCDVSHSRTTIANHDSRYSNPLLSNDTPRSIYDRRPRHKTRPDRYELKGAGPSMTPSGSGTRAQKSSAVKKRRTNDIVENLPKDTSKPSLLSASAGATGKQGVYKGKKRKENILENSFKAPNVTQDRLSLPVNHGVGFLNRARAGHGGGMGFLSNGVKRPSEREPTKHSQTKRLKAENDTNGVISRYFSKQPARPSVPNRYSSDKDAPQALSRQRNGPLSNLDVGANHPTGTEPIPEVATCSIVPNTAANSFRGASLNHSDCVPKPLWGQANRPTPWRPQIRSRMLGVRHAMLMAAKTARNIAMLDQCKKAVQHAVRMVSHEDRGRIDTEVERDYPIPKLASGYSLQQTNHAIEDMIRGENQFLAEICTVFEPELSDFSDKSEEGNSVKCAASFMGPTSPGPDSHLSGSSTTHTASKDIQNPIPPTEISGSPNAAQNTASKNSDPSQQYMVQPVAHDPSDQSNTDECNGKYGDTHTPFSHPTLNNRHPAQAQSDDFGVLSQKIGTPGPGQLLANRDSTNEPKTQTMANHTKYQLDQSMNNGIFVINQLVSRGFSSVHPSNSLNTESNKVLHAESNTGNMQSSLLCNTPKLDRFHQPEIEACTNYSFHTAQVREEAGSVISGAQGPNPLKAESIRNHQQPPAAQPLYFSGPNVPANQLTTTANGQPHNVIWYAEKIGDSPQLSANYSPCVNSGNRPSTPTSSIRSGLSRTHDLYSGWIYESNPANYIEQRLPFSPSSSVQHGHQNPNLSHVTASSLTPGVVSTALRSGSTMPMNSPWYNDQTAPWGPSYTPHHSQPILNSHSNFVHRNSFLKSDMLISAPLGSLPFSHPNKLH